MNRKNIDIAEARRLEALGLTYAQIGAIMRCDGGTVSRALHQAALQEAEAREPGPKVVVRAPRAAAVQPEVLRATRLTPDDAARAALVATGGRYHALVDWAQRHGLTFTQAQQRWHRLGLPLQRGNA